MRFDYPTVVSALALFVALPGTAYGATTITGAGFSSQNEAWLSVQMISR